MDFDKIYNGISDNYDVSETFLDDILTTLEFRLKKNHYNFNNIIQYIKSDCVNNQDFIYFEAENLIINIRSTVDNLLQLINEVYKLNLSGINVNVKNVVKHKKCTNALKDVFLLHTHPKNQFWNFIYTTRNEIVHEVCIKTQLPVLFDEIYQDGQVSYKAMFLDKYGNKEDMLFFYKQCIRLIDELCDEALHVLSKGLR